jgi:hypothetical protein
MPDRRIASIPVLAGLSVSLLVAGCANAGFYLELEGKVPLTLFQSSRVFHEEASPIQVVVRTPEDWQAFLATYPIESRDIESRAYVRERFFRVDYDRHMVIGLALGTRNSSIRVTIESGWRRHI